MTTLEQRIRDWDKHCVTEGHWRSHKDPETGRLTLTILPPGVLDLDPVVLALDRNKIVMGEG